MCGEPIPLPDWMAEEMGRDYTAWIEEQHEAYRLKARVENEYSTSPVVTVNGEKVAWLNSPMLVSNADQEWVNRIRQQLQSRESLDYYWQGE